MQRATRAKLIITVTIITAIAAGIYRQWYWKAGSPGSVAAWGTGDLKGAEKAYYTNRINNIIETWQGTRSDAERQKEGRFKDSYTTCLVIDAEKNAIWIEEAGRIRQNDHTEFPANMKWTLYRSTSEATSKLPGVTRLKQRGFNSSQWYPEQFHLVGTGRGIGHIDLHFGAGSRGTSYSSGGRVSLPTYNSSREKTDDTYPSLVLSQAEYEKIRSSLTAADPNKLDGTATQAQSPLEKDKAAWNEIEKHLYQQIEQDVAKLGYTLRNIEMKAGPDYTAAHARADLRTEGFFRQAFGGSSYYGDVYLKIDRLRDGVWYAATGPDPKWGNVRRRGQPELEFLVAPSAEITDAQRKDLIAKGRKIQQSTDYRTPAKWKATLPNGATVEFVGICENPSAGRQWWGPDGTRIDYAPYYNTRTYSRSPKDRKIYEMAWKTKFPTINGRSGGGTRTRVEGSQGSYGGSVRDRYGDRLLNLRAEGYAFKESTKKTTLSIEIKVLDGEYQKVEFQNISLVPNEDQGFKIVLQDKE